MKFIKVIKANDNWWKKYYNLRNIDMESDFNIDYGETIQEHNLIPFKFLEPKSKYFDVLSNMEPAWLVKDKKGKIFPIIVDFDQVKPLEEIDVADAVDTEWEALH